MKLQIEVRLAGSAFSIGEDDNLKDGSEIARILRNLSEYFDGDVVNISEYPLMDINGNKCGTAKITE